LGAGELVLAARHAVGEGEQAAFDLVLAADDAGHAGGDAASHFAVVIRTLKGDEAVEHVVVVRHCLAAKDGRHADGEEVDDCYDADDADGDEENAHAIGAEVVVDDPDERGDVQQHDCRMMATFAQRLAVWRQRLRAACRCRVGGSFT
jgi:hypothetical protein